MSTRRDKIAVAVVFALWFLPMTYRGLTGQALISRPQWVVDCHNVSCLFSQAVPRWPVFWVQGRTAGGGWETLDPGTHFTLRPFGHRTRLDRFLMKAGLEDHRLRADLARYFLSRPQHQELEEIRFLGTWIPVTEEDPPRGPWRPPDLSRFPRNHLHLLSTHRRGDPAP